MLLSHLPLYTGLTEADLTEFLEQAFPGTNVRQCRINHRDNSCTLELETVQQALALAARERVEVLPGCWADVARVGLSLYGERQDCLQRQRIENAVKAHHVVMATLKGIQNRPVQALLQEEEGQSRLLRVVNTLPGG